MRSDIAQLDQRVAELERTQGRWQTRLDGVEQNVLLLQDRVEAQRLTLERRGLVAARTRDELPRYHPPQQQADYSYMAELPVQRLEPPAATGSPDWDAPPPAGPDQAEDGPQAAEDPDGDPGQPVVITNETLQQFVDSHGGSAAPPDSTPPPQEPVVTGERLPVTRLEPNGPAPSSASARASAAARASALTTGRTAATPTTTTTTTTTTSDGGGASLDLYQASLDHFNAGDYDQALAGFEAFLQQGPSADYADNVYYWIGECHYARGDYRQALASFQQVIHDYPDGNKVPDSLLKIGLTYEQLDDREQASQVLSSLVETYPLTEAARRASERLAQLN